jgi:hypothetical protein
MRPEIMKKLADNPRFKPAKQATAHMIVGAQPATVDLSRYSAREREIIDYLQKDEGRPLKQEEINLGLEQARAIHGDDLEG